MTLLDLLMVVLVLLYALVGWYTGTVRRVLGAAVIWISLWLAYNMGQEGGAILVQNQGTLPVADARLYAWLFFLVLLIVVLEGAAIALGNRLQVAVVAFNRGIGLLVGAISGLGLAVAITYMLTGFAQPLGGQADRVELSARDMVNGSHLAVPVTNGQLGKLLLVLLSGTLPHDPSSYFLFAAPR
jgi:uncharacterized membrane protein required for colicin V production